MQVIFQLIKHIDNSKQKVDFKEHTLLSTFIKGFLVCLIVLYKQMILYYNEQNFLKSHLLNISCIILTYLM